MPAHRPALRPLLKWSGGKRAELKFLRAAYPDRIDRLIEPFAGGAAVAFDRNAPVSWLNDVSPGLVAFYQAMPAASTREPLIDALADLDATRKRIARSVSGLDAAALQAIYTDPDPWVVSHAPAWLLGLPQALAIPARKDLLARTRDKVIRRIPALEARNGHPFPETERLSHLETGLQSGLYTTLRRIYNDEGVSGLDGAWRNAAWWFVRSLCYSGMFRYGRDGRFNVPYGGIGYNRRDFTADLKHLASPGIADFFARSRVTSMDFEELLREASPGPGDFVFVDPPYDSAFSRYNQVGDFGQDDQRRLASALKALSAPWMLVIKNTPFISSLYQDPGLFRGVFDKKYQVNFRNRHDRAAEHLVVTNYPIPYVTPGEVGIQQEPA